MKTFRSDAIWLVRGQARHAVRRAGAGVLTRAVGLAALLAGVSLGLVPEPAPAIDGQSPALARTIEVKDATRLAALGETRAAMPAPRVAVAGRVSGGMESWRMLDPRAAGGQARFIAGDPGQTGSLTPGGFRVPAADAGGDWREEEFARVEALDGRTIAAPTLRIRLSGLEFPRSGEVCRTLDGRLEACAARAATQLELLIRHRKVTCRYRVEAASEAVGACRIGASDIGERLVRTGFIKRRASQPVPRWPRWPQARTERHLSISGT